MSVYSVLPFKNYRQVEELLRRRNPFRWAVRFELDCYDLGNIQDTRDEFGVEFSLILDRNFLSRVLSLEKPTIPLGENERLGAAVMAFAGLGRIYFNGDFALGETIVTNGVERARDEAIRFAALQNIRPRTYIDIVTCRASQLPPEEVARECTPEMVRGASQLALERWREIRPEYGAALKLATLALGAPDRIPGREQFAEFLTWCYEQYIFLPGAVLYGSKAFSRSRAKDMFKGLRSGSAQRALAGVRNAAWDMALLRHWARAVAAGPETNEFPILCSFDDALLDCATDVLAPGRSAQHKLDLLRTRWVGEWGPKVGNELADRYTACLIGVTTDSRRAARRHAHQQAHWSAEIDQLEEAFIWAVTH